MTAGIDVDTHRPSPLDGPVELRAVVTDSSPEMSAVPNCGSKTRPAPRARSGNAFGPRRTGRTLSPSAPQIRKYVRRIERRRCDRHDHYVRRETPPAHVDNRDRRTVRKGRHRIPVGTATDGNCGASTRGGGSRQSVCGAVHHPAFAGSLLHVRGVPSLSGLPRGRGSWGDGNIDCRAVRRLIVAARTLLALDPGGPCGDRHRASPRPSSGDRCRFPGITGDDQPRDPSIVATPRRADAETERADAALISHGREHVYLSTGQLQRGGRHAAGSDA